MPTNDLRLPDDWVRVASTIPVPLSEVWNAITQPDRVGQWLGDLDAPMLPGTAVRIDFGDGDFFDVGVNDQQPEAGLAFRWRFLGVGPESAVRWQLATADGRTTITVDDSCPGRPPSEVAQLKAGWRDFLGRLDSYLMTGESARYQWREVIDGGADLPAGPWLPLRQASVTDWMPIAAEGSQIRWFFIVDNDGPRRFHIRDWELVADESVRFQVAVPQARATTSCEVRASHTDGGLRLAVTHDGWARLGLGDVQARNLRHRFAAAWTAALRLAEEHAHRATKQDLR
jgi:uncharacterized protein YndB with AHSA1/START domain